LRQHLSLRRRDGAAELRKAAWNALDLEASEWRIPAERMKMKAKHIVPRSMMTSKTELEIKIYGIR
jgi:integrase